MRDCLQQKWHRQVLFKTKFAIFLIQFLRVCHIVEHHIAHLHPVGKGEGTVVDGGAVGPELAVVQQVQFIEHV